MVAIARDSGADDGADGEARDPGKDCEFIVLLKTYMRQAGLEKPHELYRALKGYGPPASKKSVSWPLIKAYFKGTKKPQPWFILACVEVLGLNKRQACDLALACLRSYHTPGRFED